MNSKSGPVFSSCYFFVLVRVQSRGVGLCSGPHPSNLDPTVPVGVGGRRQLTVLDALLPRLTLSGGVRFFQRLLFKIFILSIKSASIASRTTDPLHRRPRGAPAVVDTTRSIRLSSSGPPSFRSTANDWK